MDNLIKLSPSAEYHLSVYGPDGSVFRNPYPADDLIIERGYEYYLEARKAASFYRAAQSTVLQALRGIQGTVFGVIPSNGTIDRVESADFLNKVIKEAILTDKNHILSLLKNGLEIKPTDIVSFAARVLQLAFYDTNPQRKLRIRVGRDLRKNLLDYRVNKKDNVGGLSAFLGVFLSRLGFKAKCFISESSHEALNGFFKNLVGVEFIQSGRIVSPEQAKFDSKEPGNIVCKTENINFRSFLEGDDFNKIPPLKNGTSLSVDLIITNDDGIPTIEKCSHEFLEELSKEIPVYFLSSINKARSSEELNKFFDNIKELQSRFSWAFSSFTDWSFFGAGVQRFRDRITTFSLNTTELFDIVRTFDTWFKELPCSVSNKEEIQRLFSLLLDGNYDIQSAEWMVHGLNALQALLGDRVNIVLRGHYINISSYPRADRFNDNECDDLRDINMFSRALAAQKVFLNGGVPQSLDEIGVVNFPFTVKAIETFRSAVKLFENGAQTELSERYWGRVNDRLVVLIPTMPFLVRSGTAGAGDTMDLGRVLATQALLGDRVDVRLI